MAFLADPATHGGAPVDRVSTHGAHVFMAGDRAYKLKRAVNLGFLDFTLPAQRRAMLDAEMKLNRDGAPQLYLDVRAVARGADGRLTFGAGEPIDWVLVMRRFDQDALLDRVAARGALTEAMIDSLAVTIARMHAAAPAVTAPTAPTFRQAALDNIAVVRASPLPRNAVDAADRALTRALDDLADYLKARAAAGFVRRTHGDLHLGNIAVVDGQPIPFDALEFDAALATGDVYYDLAFLIMDLEHRGQTILANRLLNRYVALTGDIAGLRGLPLCLAIRAAVRAKVAAIAAGQSGDAGPLATAGAYLKLMGRYVPAPAPRLVAIGGLSGTGKTAVARAIAPALVPAPGALILRSDVVRKSLCGVPETQRLPAEFYTRELSARVYAALYQDARVALAAGWSVIVDAVFAAETERAAVAAVARDLALPFAGVWLEAPLDVRKARVGQRRGDASDADADVVGLQDSYALGRMQWARCDAAGSPADTLTKARALLGLTAAEGAL